MIFYRSFKPASRRFLIETYGRYVVLSGPGSVSNLQAGGSSLRLLAHGISPGGSGEFQTCKQAVPH